jgi:hypothetical protein
MFNHLYKYLEKVYITPASARVNDCSQGENGAEFSDVQALLPHWNGLWAIDRASGALLSMLPLFSNHAE